MIFKFKKYILEKLFLYISLLIIFTLFIYYINYNVITTDILIVKIISYTISIILLIAYIKTAISNLIGEIKSNNYIKIDNTKIEYKYNKNHIIIDKKDILSIVYIFKAEVSNKLVTRTIKILYKSNVLYIKNKSLEEEIEALRHKLSHTGYLVKDLSIVTSDTDIEV